MVVVSYSGKEINAKLVYYGAGLCGKTTNLEAIYEAVPDTSRGKMVSMKTQSDRTLFFDLLPLDLGEIMGFKTRFLLYTVPGQVFYNATRKLVLKGADAIVFVADSEVGKMEENKESLGEPPHEPRRVQPEPRLDSVGAAVQQARPAERLLDRGAERRAEPRRQDPVLRVRRTRRQGRLRDLPRHLAPADGEGHEGPASQPGLHVDTLAARGRSRRAAAAAARDRPRLGPAGRSRAGHSSTRRIASAGAPERKTRRASTTAARSSSRARSASAPRAAEPRPAAMPAPVKAPVACRDPRTRRGPRAGARSPWRPVPPPAPAAQATTCTRTAQARPGQGSGRFRARGPGAHPLSWSRYGSPRVAVTRSSSGSR